MQDYLGFFADNETLRVVEVAYIEGILFSHYLFLVMFRIIAD